MARPPRHGLNSSDATTALQVSMRPILRLNTSTPGRTAPCAATSRLFGNFEPLAHQAAQSMRAHNPFTKGGVSSTVLDLRTRSQQGHPTLHGAALLLNSTHAACAEVMVSAARNHTACKHTHHAATAALQHAQGTLISTARFYVTHMYTNTHRPSTRVQKHASFKTDAAANTAVAQAG